MNAICPGSSYYIAKRDRRTGNLGACPKCGAEVALSKTGHLYAHRLPAEPATNNQQGEEK